MVLEMDQWHYFLAHIKDAETEKNRFFSVGGAFFYNQSTSKSKQREFFLKNCSECYSTITQSPAGGPDPVTDINSAWLQLDADIQTNPAFSSHITLSPERQVIGGIFNVHFDFDRWTKGLTLSAIIPVVNVRHKTGFKETNIVSAGSFNGITNAESAFNNPTWNYGKIVPCAESKTGFDDIHIKLDWKFLRKSRYSMGIYASLFVPTHGRSKADYLFEPTIGNGGHVGFGGGLHAGFVLCKNEKNMLTLYVDGRYDYFFKGEEKRSFDLCPNGEWSRYLLVAQQNALQTPLPGINFFTREVDVTPRSNAEFLTALHHNYKRWNFEIGYNYWFQQKEKLELQSRCDATPFGVFDLPHVLNATQGSFTTASTAQINEAFNAVEDQAPIYVTDNNFNLDSAAHPQASSCKLYGSVGYDFDCGKFPALCAVGGSYEWGHKKSAFSQWGVSAKTSLSF
jgi:hypothetical protein